MHNHTMEIWGFCADCGQRYLVPADTVRALVAAGCPACGTPPQRLEQRLGDLVIELDIDGGRSPDHRPERPTHDAA